MLLDQELLHGITVLLGSAQATKLTVSLYMRKLLRGGLRRIFLGGQVVGGFRVQGLGCRV